MPFDGPTDVATQVDFDPRRHSRELRNEGSITRTEWSKEAITRYGTRRFRYSVGSLERMSVAASSISGHLLTARSQTISSSTPK